MPHQPPDLVSDELNEAYVDASMCERILKSPQWQWQATDARERIRALTEKILAGSLSHDDYMRAAGEVAGLRWMLSRPERVHAEAIARVGKLEPAFAGRNGGTGERKWLKS